jgi:hypothetical protein
MHVLAVCFVFRLIMHSCIHMYVQGTSLTTRKYAAWVCMKKKARVSLMSSDWLVTIAAWLSCRR